jgi:uncharacterized SAM-binding protein YcdF (DUF218 family)
VFRVVCSLLALIVALSVGVLNYRSTFIDLLATPLIVRDDPKDADVIVVLLGGDRNERIENAATLYEKKSASRIIFCDGFLVSGWKEWWYRNRGWINTRDEMVSALTSLGIPNNAITVVSCGSIHDTASEVSALSQRLDREGVRSVVLSTSDIHSRRAKWIWQHRAAHQQIYSTPSTTLLFTDKKSYRRIIRALAYEYVAFVKEWLIQAQSDILKRFAKPPSPPTPRP